MISSVARDTGPQRAERREGGGTGRAVHIARKRKQEAGGIWVTYVIVHMLQRKKVTARSYLKGSETSLIRRLSIPV
ncbi:hypothetical protein GOODEAATRI_006698 [Goodea atripinnis]|uniref:Uncharacterized protein n=1 Tax=Goodea atripinnis TaxID=208336 RepID=A0ABV0N2F2_9TELE